MRLFFAINLPSQIKEKLFLLEKDFLSYNLPVKWVEKENFHLSLAFLGNLSEKEIDLLIKIGRQTAQIFQPFSIFLDTIGAFPSLKFPRVIWVGLKENLQLKNLHFALNKNLLENGFSLESREFSPHITLGRARVRIENFYQILEKINIKKIENTSFFASSFVLYESKLSRTGPLYFEIASFAFNDKNLFN